MAAQALRRACWFGWAPGPCVDGLLTVVLRPVLCLPAAARQEDAPPVVTFPDDYPNSVRHFLLIGFLAMFIGAGVFFYMGVSRKVNTTMHTVVFFVCAITAMCVPAPCPARPRPRGTRTAPRVLRSCRRPCARCNSMRAGGLTGARWLRARTVQLLLRKLVWPRRGVQDH